MPERTDTIAAGHTVQADPSLLSILAIVVLYKMPPSASTALQTLHGSATHLRGLPAGSHIQLRILVADNTPARESSAEDVARQKIAANEVAAMFPEAEYQAGYRAFPDNPGLAPLYNLAIAEGEQAGIGWLLTLDQDSQLPVDFLAAMAQMAATVSRQGGAGKIVAIVPRVFDGARPVSPFRFVYGFPRIVGPEATGTLGTHASAINSASLLSMPALRSVGGYDERFPLNNSDTALFHRLDCAGYRLALAGDVVVQHEFAMLQREDRMTVERYRQLLKDERTFWDLYMNGMARAERLIRLMGRLVRSYMGGDDKVFRAATAQELRYRLFTPRARRIRDASLQAADASAVHTATL